MKCVTCNKKCLFSIDCRCNKSVCLRCKYNHSCSFDYKKQGKEQLVKKVFKVESEKINKI